ncbi:MAG: hypothetical protein VCB42_09405, partial [Myxococcota bacterium]
MFCELPRDGSPGGPGSYCVDIGRWMDDPLDPSSRRSTQSTSTRGDPMMKFLQWLIAQEWLMRALSPLIGAY